MVQVQPEEQKTCYYGAGLFVYIHTMTHHKRTLYVSDLDGTLLNEESRITSATAESLNRLMDEGMLFTIATARTPATVVELMADVKLAMPVILMTGALVYDIASNSYLSVSSFPHEVSAQLLDAVRDNDLSPMLYYIEGSLLHVAYRPTADERQCAFMECRKGTPYKKYVEIEGPLMAHPNTVLIFFMGAYDRLQAIYNRIASIEGHRSYLYCDSMQPEQGYLEIYPSGTSKAEAIRQVAQLVGADEIVAFGDNVNDLPMFDIAHRTYAPANALTEVKARATQVIAANGDEGVAKFLEQDFKQ